MQKWKKFHILVVTVLLLALLGPVAKLDQVSADVGRINLSEVEHHNFGQMSLKWDAYVEIGKEFDRFEIIQNGEILVVENLTPVRSKEQGDGLYKFVEYEFIGISPEAEEGSVITYQVNGWSNNELIHTSNVVTVTMPGMDGPDEPEDINEDLYLGLDKATDESITIYFSYVGSQAVDHYKVLVDGDEVGEEDEEGLFRIVNLLPKTDYEITVIAEDVNGQTILETTEVFSTLNAPTGAMVKFPDKILEAAIKEQLGLERDLLESDLEQIVSLDLYEKGISDLTGIEKLVNLEWLELSYNQIVDLTPLTQLSKLDALDLTGNPITDGRPLGQISSLTSLDLGSVKIKDFSFLKNLQKLDSLRLDDNQLENIEFLSGMENLVGLTLYDNNISDLNTILSLSNLEFLELKNNPIVDLAGIEGLQKLMILDLRLTQITNISAVEQLAHLNYLVLGNMPKLDLSEYSPARNTIQKLEEKGVQVYFNDPAKEVKNLLHVNQVSTDSISVSWDNYENYDAQMVSINDDYYELEGKESFEFTHLKPNTNYFLTLELVNDSDDNIYSTVQVRTLPVETGEPEHPSTGDGEGNTEQPGTGNGGSEKPGTGNNQGTEQPQQNNGSDGQNNNSGGNAGQVTKDVTVVVPTVKGNQAAVSTTEVVKVVTGGTFMVNLGKEIKEEIDVVLTKEQIQKLKEKGAALAVKNEAVSLHIPISIFADETTSVTLKKLPTVTNAVSDVYDFTITQGNKVVSQFSQPITLTFNVNLDGVKDPSKLKVFYYNEKTGKWENIGGTFANGVVTAETSHFSTYTVFESNESNVSTQGTGSVVTKSEGENLPNTATSMFNYLAIGMILLLIGTSLLLVNRRKQA
ncbi:leucine-rich repeat domain-containing protein [Neobacillus sp. K501]